MHFYCKRAYQDWTSTLRIGVNNSWLRPCSCSVLKAEKSFVHHRQCAAFEYSLAKISLTQSPIAIMCLYFFFLRLPFFFSFFLSSLLCAFKCAFMARILTLRSNFRNRLLSPSVASSFGIRRNWPNVFSDLVRFSNQSGYSVRSNATGVASACGKMSSPGIAVPGFIGMHNVLVV